MPVIVEDVDECATNLQRRAERARVVAVCEDGTATPEPAIEPASQANCEALHRARKRALPVGFCNQVQVIRLHSEMNEPRSMPFFRGAERSEDDRHERASPEIRDAFAQTQRHVHGMVRGEPRTLQMRDARLPTWVTTACGPSAGTFSRTAPTTQRELELARTLLLSDHVNLNSIYFLCVNEDWSETSSRRTIARAHSTIGHPD